MGDYESLAAEVEALRSEVEMLREMVICGGCRADVRVCEWLKDGACYRKSYPQNQVPV